MKRAIASVVLLALLPVAVARAREAEPMAQDPALEARLRALSEELRCLVCQNQTLAESDAGLAQDLRREIRTLMQGGSSDSEIIDFLVERYGDFVLYRPPLRATTGLLWFGPVLMMVLGLGLLLVVVRRRRARLSIAPLSDEERRRVEKLLGQRDPTA